MQLGKELAHQPWPAYPNYPHLLISLQLFTPMGMPHAHLPIQILPNLQDLYLNASPLNLPLIYADHFLFQLFTTRKI